MDTPLAGAVVEGDAILVLPEANGELAAPLPSLLGQAFVADLGPGGRQAH